MIIYFYLKINLHKLIKINIKKYFFKNKYLVITLDNFFILKLTIHYKI